MWAWIRTPRGSTTTALVVAVILALLWFDPWNRPLRHPLAVDGDPGPAPQAMSSMAPGPQAMSAAPPAPQAIPGSAPALPAMSANPVASQAGPTSPGAPQAPPGIAPVATPPGADKLASSGSKDLRAPGPPAPSQPATAGTAPDTLTLAPAPTPPGGPDKEASATSGAVTDPAARPAAPPSGDNATSPSFDIVRVEPDGSTVVAGRGEPGSEVVLLDGDRPLARAQVDKTGQFALVPPTLDAGDHTLALQTTRTDHAPVRSAQSVAVSVARQAGTRPLVALLSPDKPAEILSDGASGSAAPASPVSTVPLAIQTVEAQQAGQFMATGVAKPGTSNRVYLNGSFVAEVTTGPNGRWSVEVQKGMTPGRYQVRADQVEPASGKVVSRVEVPFDYPDSGAPAGRPTRVAQAGGAASLRDAGTRAGGVAVGASGTSAGGSASQGTAIPQGRAAPQGHAPQGQAASVATPPRGAVQEAAAGQANLSATPSKAVAGSVTPVTEGSARPSRPAVASATAPDLPQGSASAVVSDLKTTTVAKGQSLWRISRKMLGRGVRYTEIYATNVAQIKDPALIYPGQVFVMPTQRVN